MEWREERVGESEGGGARRRRRFTPSPRRTPSQHASCTRTALAVMKPALGAMVRARVCVCGGRWSGVGPAGCAGARMREQKLRASGGTACCALFTTPLVFIVRTHAARALQPPHTHPFPQREKPRERTRPCLHAPQTFSVPPSAGQTHPPSPPPPTPHPHKSALSLSLFPHPPSLLSFGPTLHGRAPAPARPQTTSTPHPHQFKPPRCSAWPAPAGWSGARPCPWAGTPSACPPSPARTRWTGGSRTRGRPHP